MNILICNAASKARVVCPTDGTGGERVPTFSVSTDTTLHVFVSGVAVRFQDSAAAALKVKGKTHYLGKKG